MKSLSSLFTIIASIFATCCNAQYSSATGDYYGNSSPVYSNQYGSSYGTTQTSLDAHGNFSTTYTNSYGNTTNVSSAATDAYGIYNTDYNIDLNAAGSIFLFNPFNSAGNGLLNAGGSGGDQAQAAGVGGIDFLSGYNALFGAHGTTTPSFVVPAATSGSIPFVAPGPSK